MAEEKVSCFTASFSSFERFYLNDEHRKRTKLLCISLLSFNILVQCFYLFLNFSV